MEDLFWYLLRRDDEFEIVYCTTGDPLHGRGSWSEHSGPYETWAEADAVMGTLEE